MLGATWSILGAYYGEIIRRILLNAGQRQYFRKSIAYMSAIIGLSGELPANKHGVQRRIDTIPRNQLCTNQNCVSKEMEIEALKITTAFVTLHFNLIDHLPPPMRNQLWGTLI